MKPSEVDASDGSSLTGPLPPDIFTPPYLSYFHVYSNILSGGIPVTLSNAVNLTVFSVGLNHFTSLPALDNLTKLTSFNIEENSIQGQFPAITSWRSLVTVRSKFQSPGILNTCS